MHPRSLPGEYVNEAHAGGCQGQAAISRRSPLEASHLPFNKDDVVIQSGLIMIDTKRLLFRCVVQLLLIDMLQDAVSQHYESAA